LPLCAGFWDCFRTGKVIDAPPFYLNVILADWETILDSQCSLMNKSAKANV